MPKPNRFGSPRFDPPGHAVERLRKLAFGKAPFKGQVTGMKERRLFSKEERQGCCARLRPLFLLLFLIWVLWLLRGLARLCRLAGRERERRKNTNVPSWAYRQPDPLIYCQTELMAQGLAVTWDNPDIHLELASAPGTPVDSATLNPDTDYVVVARIWNGSTTAPAVDLPVHVSYLEFGIATISHDIALTTVDLAVKGAAGCPAFARVPWHTPATPGHYCVQVALIWSDDANPGNNLGQENTNVMALNSPHAAFQFPLRNPAERARLLRLEIDNYRIPDPIVCPPDASDRELEEHRRVMLARHQRSAWAIPEGWQVIVEPHEVQLEAGATAMISVDITSPDGFRGRGVFNVNAFDGPDLLGGVTLYVDGSG